MDDVRQFSVKIRYVKFYHNLSNMSRVLHADG